MKITNTQLRKIIQEELLKEFGSEEYGPQTKEFEPIPVAAVPSPVKEEAVVDDDDALSYFAKLAEE